jgi:hypothetical protein
MTSTEIEGTPVTSVPEGVPQPGVIPGHTVDNTPQPVQADYFGVDVTEKHMLPDGISYLLLQKLDEGARRLYLNKTNSDVLLERASGNARIKSERGEERRILFEAAIVGWNLAREGRPVPFSNNGRGSELGKFLDHADPTLMDDVEKHIRLMNPWLLTDMTVEAIDKEIASLEEMRAKLVEQEEGNGSSGDK